jgi:hypothetical protein
VLCAHFLTVFVAQKNEKRYVAATHLRNYTKLHWHCCKKAIAEDVISVRGNRLFFYGKKRILAPWSLSTASVGSKAA